MIFKTSLIWNTILMIWICLMFSQPNIYKVNAKILYEILTHQQKLPYKLKTIVDRIVNTRCTPPGEWDVGYNFVYILLKTIGATFLSVEFENIGEFNHIK